MKSFFAAITRLSLRFGALTLILAALISALGIIAITQLRQELIPPIETPQTIILTQASGLTSDQVLNVLTTRLENELSTIPEISNLESTTTASFGSVIIARNDFGLNQPRLRANIQAALERVWLPTRTIAPPEGEDGAVFAARLLGELPPDVLIYLARRDSNFLFQLSPEVWSLLPADTVRAVAAYLANQTPAGGETALRRLVEQEIVPQLDALPQVSSIGVSGGQVLPGEGGVVEAPAETEAAVSLLEQLSVDAWAAISARAGLDADRATAVETLRGETVTVPTATPTLPESWQMDRFATAQDLFEMRTLTRTLGTVFNSFADTGEIAGALGQTNDLTAEDVTRLLEIDPTMVEYLEADHLVALSDEAFAALPADYLAALDGFSRDALAAQALAAALTGEDAAPIPVDLPSAWRLSPPQIVTFSFDDLPLATFTIAGDASLSETAVTSAIAETPEETAAEAPAATEPPDIPEGPVLPSLLNLVGGQFLGVELDTADDLIGLQLSEEAAAQFGASELSAAEFINALTLIGGAAGGQGGAGAALPEGVDISAFLPALTECGINPLALGSGQVDFGAALLGCISPDVFAFLAEQDPTFAASLQPGVYNGLSPEVLALPAFAPPLDQVWDTLAAQPEFAANPLQNAADLIALTDGSPSAVLNLLNETAPEAFAGYEVRLFNSLTPAILNYFVQQEPAFWSAVASEVVVKFSPETLAALPDEAIEALDDETQDTVAAIAAGDQPSAAEQVAERYQTDAPPADPNAPALNSDWQFVGDFIGVELDTADDLIRFFPNPLNFLNSFWDTARGAAFAPNLYGNLPADALAYWAERLPTLYDELRLEAWQLMPDDVLATLPQDVQDRIASGAPPFTPTDWVTRTDGQSGMLVTVFKTRDANTIEAFYAAEEVLREIDERDEAISVGLAFEQASFIEESISGVAREGVLGAIFAVVMILIFLSSGVWSRRPRTIVGAVLIVLFAGILLALTSGQVPAAGGDWGRAFELVDVVWRFLLIIGIAIGVIILLLPRPLPYPSWRSTLVTAVSIPLSILMAFVFMRWLSPAMHGVIAPGAENSSLLAFLLRLFPESITINIMTLSGLTVAIGRVVDDSIVVLENIFRQVQAGGDRREAILTGVKDVSVAIFVATLVTVVVFLPLGLTGGIIGAFFLPFGLAVSYALAASFIVAITVVPLLAYLLLDPREIGEHEEGFLERLYVPALEWALSAVSHRWAVIGLALLSAVIGIVLFANRPQTFLPAFGEPQIGVTVTLPAGTKIVDTDVQVARFEQFIAETLPADEVTRVQAIIGSTGLSFEALLLGTSGVTENQAAVTIGLDATQARVDELAAVLRGGAEEIFGVGNVIVSSASLSEQGGFGGFSLEMTGPQEELLAANARVIETLSGVPGLINVTSSLSGDAAAGGESIIRIDGQNALRYVAELETTDTLGVTDAAIQAVRAMPDLPSTLTIDQGYESRSQVEGFANLFVAMGVAIAIVVVILVVTFRSLLHWLAIIFSIIVAPVGAAIFLALTDRVLGISALIGLLMLIGIVVTNAVVLIDRVQANRHERGMNVHDALLEAGGRRLRPILMTALATVCALAPLAVGLSKGAIIAAELGTVVIGGLVSSTLLTLLVTPVVYSFLAPLHNLFGRSEAAARRKAGQPAGD